MATITIRRGGNEYICNTSIVANNRGAVVVIEVTSGAQRFGRVGIFPPYHASFSAPVHTVPSEELQAEVLNRFANDEYELTLSWLLQRYEVLLAHGTDQQGLEVKTRSMLYVHPVPEA